MRRLYLLLFVIIIIHPLWCKAASNRPVEASKGMVGSAQRLASETGVRVLKSRGNAVDAAVATAFALAVVHPTAGNIGGGGFMVIRFADGRATTIDFRETAPLKAHRDMYLKPDGTVDADKSQIGYLAVGVPGSVAGLCLALQKYGSKPLARVITPAIQLAEQGFLVTDDQAESFAELQSDFQQFPPTAKIFLKPDGSPYRKGERFVQKDLARTLKLIAAEGPDAFYKGEIAQLIAADMARHSGLITLDDLAAYQAVERPPVKGMYRGYEIISMGPPSSGGIALVQILNILENAGLRGKGHNSSQYVHLLAEAMRRAFADRAEYLGDPDFVSVPVQGLLSKEYALSLYRTIDSFKATESRNVKFGNPHAFQSEGKQTTHFSVIDASGMAVSVTTTLNDNYGSRAVVDGAGFLLNNEMDDFTAKPGSPNLYELIQNEANAIAPRKRMLSSMAPTIVVKDGEPFLVIGSRGGPHIINTVLQVILNVIDFDMNIQDAIDAPRFHHQYLPDEIRYERAGLAADVVEHLQSMGHLCKEVIKVGEAHGIHYDAARKKLYGAADRRSEGAAIGLD